MAGEVGDSQHLVTQGRNEKQVNFGKYASHLVRYLVAEAVGLNEIHSGKEPALAKDIWPGIIGLHLQLIQLSTKCELFEGCGCFGEQNEIE